MSTGTVEAVLNDKALRADWPKLPNTMFEDAVRLAAFATRALSADPWAMQYFMSFVMLRRGLSRVTLRNITLVGPKLSDFMDVISEVSGLAVVQRNNGLWFFDMRGRQSRSLGYEARKFGEHFATILPESPIVSLSDADEDGDESEDEDEDDDSDEVRRYDPQ